MLPKKQFNGAVARLRDIATTPDLMQMLAHQLTKANDDGEHNELLALLSKADPQLEGTKLLDRRRAENYLANALYGRNHSQVAHMMPKDTPLEPAHKGATLETSTDTGMASDTDSERLPAKEAAALRKKLLNRLIEHLGRRPHHLSTNNKKYETMRQYGVALSRQLNAADEDACNFQVGIIGAAAPSTIYSTEAYHVAVVFVTFLSIEMRVELAYTRGLRSPLIDTVFESRTIVNGLGIKGYTEYLVKERGIDTDSQSVYTFFEELAVSLAQCATPDLIFRGDLDLPTYPKDYEHPSKVLVAEAYSVADAAKVHLRYLIIKELRVLARTLRKSNNLGADSEIVKKLSELTRTDPVPNSFYFSFKGQAFLERLEQITTERWASRPSDRPPVEDANARIILENIYHRVNLVITLRIKRGAITNGWYAGDLEDALEEARLTLNGHRVCDHETHPQFWRELMLMLAHHSGLAWMARQKD